jgi:5-(carboxyamino)imidazole ribonucleotide mutase
VPVATVGIGQARNAGLLAVRILGLADRRLWPDMDAYRAGLRASAMAKGERLRERVRSLD